MMHLSNKSSIKQNIVDFLIWLLWPAAVILILSTAVYLFVGGSTLFTNGNTLPIVAYRQVSDGVVTLSGSMMMPSVCSRLNVQTAGDASAQELNFSFNNLDECTEESVGSDGLPETFLVSFDGDEQTQVRARVMGDSREIIIK